MSKCHNPRLTRNFIRSISTKEAIERAERITRLIEKPRMMTPEAAATVVDAAMFGIGCVEGTVRQEMQAKLDKEAQKG